MIYDVVIIGAGPGGLGAGVYSARGGLKTIIFEKGLVGGQIVLTNEVENYPGFEVTMSGFDLIDKMKAQVDKFGAEFKTDEVLEIKVEGLWKIIKTSKETYKAKVVIFSTGAFPRKMNVPGEERLTGRGVSYCATCDGALYRNSVVAIVGGGDSAVEEALFLTKFASKVYIIHRRDKLRAVHAIQERAFKNEKIEIVWDSVVKEINGDQFVQSLTLLNKKTNVESDLKVDGVFIYVGVLPNNQLLKDQVELDSGGFIITDEKMQTKLPGVYAAGDIVHKVLRQVVTAVSDGAIAAFSAEKWIDENDEELNKTL